jgi:hypothetical protein
MRRTATRNRTVHRASLLFLVIAWLPALAGVQRVAPLQSPAVTAIGPHVRAVPQPAEAAPTQSSPQTTIRIDGGPVPGLHRAPGEAHGAWRSAILAPAHDPRGTRIPRPWLRELHRCCSGFLTVSASTAPPPPPSLA